MERFGQTEEGREAVESGHPVALAAMMGLAKYGPPTIAQAAAARLAGSAPNVEESSPSLTSQRVLDTRLLPREGEAAPSVAKRARVESGTRNERPRRVPSDTQVDAEPWGKSATRRVYSEPGDVDAEDVSTEYTDDPRERIKRILDMADRLHKARDVGVSPARVP